MKTYKFFIFFHINIYILLGIFSLFILFLVSSYQFQRTFIYTCLLFNLQILLLANKANIFFVQFFIRLWLVFLFRVGLLSFGFISIQCLIFVIFLFILILLVRFLFGFAFLFVLINLLIIKFFKCINFDYIYSYVYQNICAILYYFFFLI